MSSDTLQEVMLDGEGDNSLWVVEFAWHKYLLWADSAPGALAGLFLEAWDLDGSFGENVFLCGRLSVSSADLEEDVEEFLGTGNWKVAKDWDPSKPFYEAQEETRQAVEWLMGRPVTQRCSTSIMHAAGAPPILLVEGPQVLCYFEDTPEEILVDIAEHEFPLDSDLSN